MSRRGRWLAAALCLWLAVAARAQPTADADDDDDALQHDDGDDADGLALDQEESRNVRPRAYSAASAAAGAAYNALPSGFRPSASLAELAGYQHADHEPQQQQQRYVDQQHQHPSKQEQRRQQVHHQHQQRQEAQEAVEAEEEREREEPDRLSALLQQSRFACAPKQSGYYADEELNCEVFHYCQDGVKHSWICPDGFTFHQVHLICMPPTHDNICQQSAKYHFVNEYLYRPINEEEVQRKPNVSLKYSDRYYPAEVYHDDRFDDNEEERNPLVRPSPSPSPAQAPSRAAPPAQVFHSPEEVNIPLLQRRPQRPYDFDF